MSYTENTSDNISRLYATLPTLPIHKVRVEIDLSALRANYRAVKENTERLSPKQKPKIISVVKADAYGHGADRVTEALISEGCDFFAVSCIEEAISVRRVCDEAGSDAQILILGLFMPVKPESEKGRGCKHQNGCDAKNRFRFLQSSALPVS